MFDSAYTLVARPALDGYSSHNEKLSILEVTDKALVSLAPPRGGKDLLSRELQAAFGIDWPVQGRVSQSTDGDLRLLGLQADMALAVFARAETWPERKIRHVLSGDVYLTDQSDAWVIIEINGQTCMPCLERLCALDIDASAFPAGKVTRTMLDHIGVILWREQLNTWLVFGPRSLGADLLHLLSESAESIQR